MSQYSENNPPAFPRSYAADGHNGMSLRDWFAGQALTGELASWDADDERRFLRLGEVDRLAMFAACAYRMADAMLAARGKGDQQ